MYSHRPERLSVEFQGVRNALLTAGVNERDSERRLVQKKRGPQQSWTVVATSESAME